jgi:hypothetical protein
MRTYKLRGRRALSREARRELARAVLFLKTNEEYVHGDAIVSGTILRKGRDRVLLAVVALSLAMGLWTYIAISSFVLGFATVAGIAYVAHLVIHLVVRARKNRRARNFARVKDSHWPLLDDHAYLDSFRWWPFANRQSYDSALASPPFLRGA